MQHNSRQPILKWEWDNEEQEHQIEVPLNTLVSYELAVFAIGIRYLYSINGKWSNDHYNNCNDAKLACENILMKQLEPIAQLHNTLEANTQ